MPREQQTRFAHVNSASLDGTDVTASSARADHPAAQVGNPARGAQWITPVGWNVFAGFNDLVFFSEVNGGTTYYRWGRIVAGNYPTGDAYADAVAQAMNAAVTYPATMANVATLWARASHPRTNYARVQTGDGISPLNSWSTAAVNATITGSPLYDATDANGQAAALFNGSSDKMQADVNVSALTASAGTGYRHTGFVVAKSNASGGAQQWVLSNFSNGDYGVWYREAGGAFRFQASDGAVKFAQSAAATQGAYHIVTFMYDGTNLSIGCDDTRTASLVTTACGALTHMGEALVLGEAVLANWLNGGIAELLYYGTNISEAERVRVEGYLAAKYAITVGSSVTWTNTYTGAYDPETRLFTFTATGGATWGFAPIDYAASPETLYQELFNADAGLTKRTSFYSSAAAITAETAVSHSREFVDLDLGAASCRVTIIAGVNDRLPYVADGTTHEATMAPGTYATPDALAQAVEDAPVTGLSSTFGASWIVLWDATLNKLYAEYNGGVSGTLLFGTGAAAVAGTSAHATLGWANADVVLAPGGTSYATDETWGWNPTALVLALDHNAGGAGVFRALLNDQPNASAYARGPQSVELTLIGDEMLRIRHLHGSYGDATLAYGRRYIRLVIDDPTNEDAYSSLGVLWCGPSFALSRAWLAGRRVEAIALDTQSASEYGAITGEVRPQPFAFSGSPERLSYADRLLMEDLRESVGLVRPFVLLEDAQNAGRLVAWTRYVVLSGFFGFASSAGGSDTDANALAESWVMDGFSVRESLP